MFLFLKKEEGRSCERLWREKARDRSDLEREREGGKMQKDLETVNGVVLDLDF